jgi:hypothetical protein
MSPGSQEAQRGVELAALAARDEAQRAWLAERGLVFGTQLLPEGDERRRGELPAAHARDCVVDPFAGDSIGQTRRPLARDFLEARRGQGHQCGEHGVVGHP